MKNYNIDARHGFYPWEIKKRKDYYANKAQEYLPDQKAPKSSQSRRLNKLIAMRRKGIHNPEMCEVISTAIEILRERTGRDIWTDLNRNLAALRKFHKKYCS